MTDVREQWENYMELGERIVKGNISEKEFENEINAFSFFISEINQDYYYNATYLPRYTSDFFHFLKCFIRKYPIVKQLFELSSHYSGVSIVIDRYWKQESILDEEENIISVIHKVFPIHDKKILYDERMLIECSVSCEIKRFIHHSKIEINVTEVQDELHNLKEFLESKMSP